MWTEGVRIISNECTGKEGLEQDAVTFTVVLKVSGVGVAALEVARQLCEQTIQKAVRQMPMGSINGLLRGHSAGFPRCDVFDWN
jgi:hypothetical protein